MDVCIFIFEKFVFMLVGMYVIFGIDIIDCSVAVIYDQYLSIFNSSCYNRPGFWKFKWQFGAGPGWVVWQPNMW